MQCGARAVCRVIWGEWGDIPASGQRGQRAMLSYQRAPRGTLARWRTGRVRARSPVRTAVPDHSW